MLFTVTWASNEKSDNYINKKCKSSEVQSSIVTINKPRHRSTSILSNALVVTFRNEYHDNGDTDSEGAGAGMNGKELLPRHKLLSTTGLVTKYVFASDNF